MAHEIRQRLNDLLRRFKKPVINRYNNLKGIIPGTSVHLMQVFPVE